VFPLAFPPVLACVIFQSRAYGGRAVKLSLAGSLLGLLPVIYYNISHPGATLLRLLARPSGVDRQAASQLVNSEGIISFIVHFLTKWAYSSYQAFLSIPQFTLSLMGWAPDATVWGHLGGCIAFSALLFGLWAFLRYTREEKTIPHAILLTVIMTYCFLISFGLNRDRYLIPILLIIPFGLVLAVMRLSFLLSWRVGSLAVASLLLLNGLANFWDTKPRYPDYQGLTQFLESKKLIRGYAPYEAAYPLVYLSNERLIYSPAFHEPQYDRNDRYTELVAKSVTPAYVFNDDQEAQSFMGKFKGSSVIADEYLWENFRIIYGSNIRYQIVKCSSR
jgi:hypothetical protein